MYRGNEYLSSAPKYNRIYEAFGWEIPVYVHCPLITNEEHQKLSKRSGHSSYEDLLEQGFVTEAIVNFVALLGWSPQDNQEIFSLPELVKAFDYHHISKSPAVFDITKAPLDEWRVHQKNGSGRILRESTSIHEAGPQTRLQLPARSQEWSRQESRHSRISRH